MSIESLVIKAARKKFRFYPSKGGEYAFEDLWDLNLQSLDDIAISLDEKAQKEGRKSFVKQRSVTSSNLKDQLDLVVYVIETKKEEQETRLARVKDLQKLETLKGLRDRRKLEELETLSTADLEKQIAELEG